MVGLPATLAVRMPLPWISGGTSHCLANLRHSRRTIFSFSLAFPPTIRFRDLQSDYDALDCVVLGVSADSEASHQDFIADLGLNFSLLADTDKSVGVGRQGLTIGIVVVDILDSSLAWDMSVIGKRG